MIQIVDQFAYAAAYRSLVRS